MSPEPYTAQSATMHQRLKTASFFKVCLSLGVCGAVQCCLLLGSYRGMCTRAVSHRGADRRRSTSGSHSCVHLLLPGFSGPCVPPVAGCFVDHGCGREVVVLKYVANTRECNRPVGWVAIYAIPYFLAAFGYCIYVSVTGYKSRQSLWTRAGDHLAMLPLWGMYHIATTMALFFPQMRVGTYIFLAQVLHMLDLFRVLGFSLSPPDVGSWIFPFP